MQVKKKKKLINPSQYQNTFNAPHGRSKTTNKNWEHYLIRTSREGGHYRSALSRCSSNSSSIRTSRQSLILGMYSHLTVL